MNKAGIDKKIEAICQRNRLSVKDVKAILVVADDEAEVCQLIDTKLDYSMSMQDAKALWKLHTAQWESPVKGVDKRRAADITAIRSALNVGHADACQLTEDNDGDPEAVADSRRAEKIYERAKSAFKRLFPEIEL